MDNCFALPPVDQTKQHSNLALAQRMKYKSFIPLFAFVIFCIAAYRLYYVLSEHDRTKIVQAIFAIPRAHLARCSLFGSIYFTMMPRAAQRLASSSRRRWCFKIWSGAHPARDRHVFLHDHEISKLS
jgi:hypothetical protein